MTMLCISISVSAYEFEVDGIKYEIMSLDKMTCKVIAKTEKYTGVISIPESVVYNERTFNVSSIGANAFKNCIDMRELHLELATNLAEIEFSAFEGCSAISKVTIPSNCVKLGYNAFFGCSSLKHIIISKSDEPLILNPKSRQGEFEFKYNVINYYFGHFADCPVEQLELYRNIEYGGDLAEFSDIRYYNADIVKYFPWINSCTKNLTIGCMVTKIPYNLLLTMDPETLFFEDGETPLNIEPLTTCKVIYKPYYPTQYILGAYEMNDDGYIKIKTLEDHSVSPGPDVYGVYWGLRFPSLQKVYWGRPISTTEFTYDKYYGRYKYPEYISLVSENLKTFEYGKYLIDIGDVDFVSSSNLTNIIWNSYIEKCDIFGSTPKIYELRFPNSLNEISGFYSTGDLNSISFGSELKKISGFSQSKVKDVYIKALTPPELSEYAFNENVFIDSKLHVPFGCKNVYSTSSVWSRFWNIIEEENSGITDDRVTSDNEGTETGRYDLQGQKVSDDYQGIVIVRYSDGSTKKIIK